MKTVCVLILLICFDAVLARHYKLTATGRTLCKGLTMPFAKIELLEHNTFSSDDLLDMRISDERGDFRVAGEENVMFRVDPYIRMTHTCDAKPNCKRVSMYSIPKDQFDRLYEMGEVNLETNTYAYDEC